jgi:hypothetical protein
MSWHFSFVGFAFRTISFAQAQPDLIPNIKLLPTVFLVVVAFCHYICFVRNDLYVSTQMLSYKSLLESVFRQFAYTNQTVSRRLDLKPEQIFIWAYINRLDMNIVQVPL